MAKTYSYSNASFQKAGTMVCSVCHKKITEGQFRYYDSGKAYVSQHRNCCTDDPTWAAIDIEVAVQKKYNSDFLKACAEFQAKWDISDLDHYLE